MNNKEKIRRVCGENRCTACGGCKNICPTHSIYYYRKDDGTTIAAINTDSCINCKLCYKTCPQLNDVSAYYPQKCYAAWSLDNEIRHNSASGGIAAELYKMIIKRKGSVCGVSMDRNANAVYSLTDSMIKIKSYQNSKYVYSDTKDIFQQIKKRLQQGQEVLFIGLPCQVAGIRQFLSIVHVSDENLYTVDLVCHGVTPTEFLQNHIKYIEQKYGKKAEKIFFRDPYTYTYTYTFSLSLLNNNKRFYQRKVNRDDVYQIGYHSGITYRNNCYQCIYARAERLGDLTLADFSYVGKYAPCSYDNKKVSCILCNTDKGKKLIDFLKDEKRIYLEKRPLEEELNTEKQLQHPTVIPLAREKFLQNLKIGNSFEEAMRKAVWKKIAVNELKYYIHYNDLKRVTSKYMPQSIKRKIKRALQKS